jgi:hypothetical protein
MEVFSNEEISESCQDNAYKNNCSKIGEGSRAECKFSLRMVVKPAYPPKRPEKTQKILTDQITYQQILIFPQNIHDIQLLT